MSADREAAIRERLRRACEDGERLYRTRMHDEPTAKDDFRIDGILTRDLPDALGALDSLLADRDSWKRLAYHYQHLLGERGLL